MKNIFSKITKQEVKDTSVEVLKVAGQAFVVGGAIVGGALIVSAITPAILKKTFLASVANTAGGLILGSYAMELFDTKDKTVITKLDPDQMQTS